MKATKSQTVSYRLDTSSGNELERRARDAGVSTHEFARQLLLENLQKDEGPYERFEARVEAIDDQLERLRHDVASAIFSAVVALRSGEKLTDLSDDRIREWLRGQGLLVPRRADD